METVLIVGGAGYIGSHLNKAVNARGYPSVVFDNLVTGHLEAVKWGQFVLGDLADTEQLRLLFRHYRPRAVMHFAAFSTVGESVTNPEKYYLNNLIGALNLLRVMRENDCDKLVFSSTCAVYGTPSSVPIDENHPCAPINPYGRGKLMIENIMAEYALAYDLKYVSLRYFNAAGADAGAEIGEDHQPESHLIPLVLDAAAGRRDRIQIFGTDYPTPDGTCIRDYIHVDDLAEAHILALEYLLNGGASDFFNLGNGQGYSVREIISCVEAVTGRPVAAAEGPRREGDPPMLVGSVDKARLVLGWRPHWESLEAIVSSAWNWHQKHFCC